MVHETEEIHTVKISSLNKERTIDKTFDLSLAEMRYQTLYSRAMCYSKMEQYDLCIQVLIPSIDILAT